jgi:hypothetical protein
MFQMKKIFDQQELDTSFFYNFNIIEISSFSNASEF